MIQRIPTNFILTMIILLISSAIGVSEANNPMPTPDLNSYDPYEYGGGRGGAFSPGAIFWALVIPGMIAFFAFRDEFLPISFDKSPCEVTKPTKTKISTNKVTKKKVAKRKATKKKITKKKIVKKKVTKRKVEKNKITEQKVKVNDRQ